MVDHSEWDWLGVVDLNFRDIVQRIGDANMSTGPWVAGGSARKAWQRMPWRNGDIDFFFSSRAQFDLFSDRIMDRFGGAYKKFTDRPISQSGHERVDDLWLPDTVGSDDDIPEGALYVESVYRTQNASTFSIRRKHDDTYHLKIQAVCKRYYDRVEQLMDDFDFTICQFVTDGSRVWATPLAQADLASKTIRMSPTTTRSPKTRRLVKYTAYGFVPEHELMMAALRNLTGEQPLEAEDDDDY